MLNQKGVIHFLLLFILLAGLLAGVYLVSSGNPLKLFSKATNPPIIFKSLDGKPLPSNPNGIPQTSSPNIRVELTSTLGPPVAASSSLLTPGLVYAEEPSGYSVGVLVLKYFPLDNTGNNIDNSITGVSGNLSSIRSKVDGLTSEGLNKMTIGSKYHGYKNLSAPVALNYVQQDSKEFLKAMPVSGFKAWYKDGIFRPDYRKMLTEDVNICDYIDNKGVSQVWVWGYHHGNIEPDESNMSMGRTSQNVWNHGSYGDISNGQEIDDLPICSKTYTLFNYSYARGLGELLEDHGHTIEKIMMFVDNGLWSKFRDPYGASGGTVNHCGWTHSPPNTAKEYDWNNETTVKSNCEDWKPDGGGEVKDVNCHTWYGSTCLDNGGVEFKVWWMQNIPGLNNNLSYQSKTLRNFWELYGDFDNAMLNRTLFVSLNPSPLLSPIPVPSVTSNPSPILTPTPTPTPLTGTVSYKIAEDPTDLDKMSFIPYKTEPTVLNYTLKDQSPGVKFVWVEFKAADSRIDRRSAQIELVSPSPTPMPTATLSPTPTPKPAVTPALTPAPISISSLKAPEMVYPQNGQTIDLEGAYMFKVKPVSGASGYLFGFFQNGTQIFENQRDTGQLSKDGEFAIWESDSAHAKFKAGEVKVMIRAYINNKWTDAREITIILKSR